MIIAMVNPFVNTFFPKFELSENSHTGDGNTASIRPVARRPSNLPGKRFDSHQTPETIRANDHVDKLDRAQVSALARQVIDPKLSRLEAHNRPDDWIDAASLPSFGVGNDKAVAKKVPVVASNKPMTERANDPLDAVFA